MKKAEFNFLKISKKKFFLKYLKKKGLIVKKDDVVENKVIDLNDLLNENKVKITFSDIFRDWINFRKAYYYIKFEREPVPKTKITFDKKDMNFKNYFSELFKEYYFRKSWKYLSLAILITAYLVYRIDGSEKRNVQAIDKLTNASNTIYLEERQKYKSLKY